MAKVQHLYSTTSGNVPATLVRGQLAINIPDQLVYANDPVGRAKVISSGVPGLAGAMGSVGVHIPNALHPVAQFGVTLNQTDLQSRFLNNGTTVTLLTVPIFVFGRVWWTNQVQCPVSSAGAYSLTLDTVGRTVTMQAVPQGTGRASSGYLNYTTRVATLVIYSDSTIYPWFYLQQGFGDTIANGSGVQVYRISPVQTFGAIPVSTGFAGAPAATYWGTT